MKTISLLVQTLCVVTASIIDDRPPTINILGITDIDMIHFFEGGLSGSFGRDMKAELDGCVDGMPEIENDLTEMFNEFARGFKNLATFFDNFGNIDKIVRMALKMFTTLPSEIKECTGLVDAGTSATMWWVKHFNLSTVTSGLGANLFLHGAKIASTGWDINAANWNKDYYKVGKDIGELLTMLFN